MLSKHHMFKLVVAIAVVTSVSFAGAHRAMATRPFITDTLGGSGHAVRHAQTPHVVKATCTTTPNWAFTTDYQGNPLLLPAGSSLVRDCGPTPQIAPTNMSQDPEYQRIVTAAQNLRAAQVAAQVAQSILSQDSDHQRFVTAVQNIRAARVHGFMIITDTLGGNGTAKLQVPGGFRNTMQ